MAKGRQLTSLILDADVLIDYCQSDRSVLKLISAHIGQIHVATPVLEEVNALEARECGLLGIALIEPELEQVMQAGERRSGLSFEDHLCLLLARDNGYTCVTNEKLLRSECAKEDVAVIWGLELLAILVEQKGIAQRRAARIAGMIHESNPLYINKKVLGRFLRRIGL